MAECDNYSSLAPQLATTITSSYGAIGLDEEDDSMEYWAPIKEKTTGKKKSRGRLSSDKTSLPAMSPDQIEHESHWTDGFFSFLGFINNPFTQDSYVRNSKASDLRLAMLSNFSTAYNIVSISMALDIMQDIYDTTARDKSLCSSALIVGMIIGQLVGGALGDVLGRHVAMAVMMALQIIGALTTALAQDGYVSIYTFVAFWRFIMGLGCGGVYPLAATITAESSSDGEDGSKAVALTFSMQGVGYLVSPLLTATLVILFPHSLELCWRVLLAFGSIPGLWLMILRLENRMEIESSSSEKMREKMMLASTREVPVSVFDAVALENKLARKLLGTGGCWLIFDILFYGNVLFQPVVLSAAFGEAETVQKAAIDTSIVSALALPGYVISVIYMGRQSPRFIQAQGFLMMATLYGFIGIFFHQLATHKTLLIFLYGSTFFFSNYGPNATTYVLPSMTFSRSCRSTLNGVCAASGKAGALLGTIIFVPAAARYGQEIVMMACAVLSIAGALVTLVCVPKKPCQKKGEIDQVSKLPMRLVISEPSLIDYYQSTVG